MALNSRSPDFLAAAVAVFGAVASYALRRRSRRSAPLGDPPIEVRVPRASRGNGTANVELLFRIPDSPGLVIRDVRLLAPKGVPFRPALGSSLPYVAEPGTVPAVLVFVAETPRSKLDRGRLLIEYAWADRPKRVASLPVPIAIPDAGFWQD